MLNTKNVFLVHMSIQWLKYVVVIENLKMPSTCRTATYNAQYCCLFFRPWTLREDAQDSTVVPPLRELGMDRETRLCHLAEQEKKPEDTKRRYQKTSDNKDSEMTPPTTIKWATAWDEYVRGKIVSKSARKIIQSFLLKTLAASGHEHDEDESEAEHAYEDPEIPALHLSATALEKFLNPELDYETYGKSEPWNEEANDVLRSGEKFKKVLKRKMKEDEYHRSIALGINLWQTPRSEVSADDRREPGHMFADSFEDHIAALKNKDHKVLKTDAPFEEKRHTAAFWYEGNAANNLDIVFEKILRQKEPPNLEQRKFLKHFMTRLKIEILEMQMNTVNKSVEEPLLDLIHGFPGTGKSRLIMWTQPPRYELELAKGKQLTKK